MIFRQRSKCDSDPPFFEWVLRTAKKTCGNDRTHSSDDFKLLRAAIRWSQNSVNLKLCHFRLFQSKVPFFNCFILFARTMNPFTTPGGAVKPCMSDEPVSQRKSSKTCKNCVFTKCKKRLGSTFFRVNDQDSEKNLLNRSHLLSSCF